MGQPWVGDPKCRVGDPKCSEHSWCSVYARVTMHEYWHWCLLKASNSAQAIDQPGLLCRESPLLTLTYHIPKKLIRRLIYFIIAEYLGKPKVLIDVNSPGTTVDSSSNEQGCRKWARCRCGGQLLALQLPGALAKSMSESNEETIQETTSKEANLTQFQK